MMRLSLKNSNGARLGRKAIGGGRLALKNTEKIEDVSGTVAGVANKVSGGLATGATLAAMTGAGAPVAAGLATLSGAAASVGAVAGSVNRGAATANKVKSRLRAVDRFLG